MITEPIFYRPFETSPETFFLVLGRSPDACDRVARARTEIPYAALRADLLEFIETVILYKAPKLTREEIRVMFGRQEADGQKNCGALGR
jgi:hypothetical protein